MTILYLINDDINKNSGVIEKVTQQSKVWIENGYKVYFLSTGTLTIYDENKIALHKIKQPDINFGKLGNFIKFIYNFYFLPKLLDKIEFDIIYMRYMRYIPVFASILKRHTVIMEINSDDILEYKLRSKFRYYYNLFTRNLILKHVNAFVSVSNELKERFEFLGKPIIVIANGINTKNYMVAKKKNDQQIFVFIGSPNQSWHGMDKILTMAKHYNDYLFYIIGSDGIDSKNVKYFGYLSQDEASVIISNADIGIATLSLYKKGLSEASPLKTRQYLACGLPIIYAYNDTDIDKEENIDFTLQLDNSEKNIDFNKIDLWIEKVFLNENISRKAREFAKNRLDFKIKEKKRLEFFNKIINRV